MKRNIVVLADGTGNSAGKAFKTNVWRLYQALDLGGAAQIASFSDGVGTSQFKPFEIIGLALGFGIKRRVLALYKFLCRNYRDGDDIYAFGFSRGAFTARLLVGLVTREGLVDFKSEEELDRNALAAYRAYREHAFSTWMPWVKFGRWARDGVVRVWNKAIGNRQYDEVKPKEGDDRAAGEVKIMFLGVWDTVAAYGLPVDELTRAVNGVVWPLTFESKGLLDSVKRARQAFSIDDERRTFFPIHWDEPPPKIPGEIAPRLQQVWFAGSHSNVGGGYPDDRLAHIPLCWMIAEAAECGLVFKPDVVAEYWDYASATGRTYDSRSALGVFYRYHPRSAAELVGGKGIPLVHSSVLVRMADGSDGYAPVALPQGIEILTPSGNRMPFGHFAQGKTPESIILEKPKDWLPLPKSRQRKLDRMEGELAAALERLEDDSSDADRRERVNLMDDTIWWRRGLYYVLLLLTIVAALFPFLADYINPQPTEQIDLQLKGAIGPLLGLLKGLLPGFAAIWIDSVGLHPLLAAGVILPLGLCLWLSGLLRTRIADRARKAWNIAVRKDERKLEADRATAHRSSALLGALLFAGATLVAVLRGGSDAAGFFGVLALGCLATFGLTRRPSYTGHDRPGVGSFLGVARWIRNQPWAITLYCWLRTWILPGAFLFASIILILGGVNKAAFEVADSMGAFCAEPTLPETMAPLPAQKAGEQPAAAVSGFDIATMCADTGIKLKEGVTYRIELSVTKRWTDGDYPADPYGFSAGAHGIRAALLFTPATLIKRWWAEPWMRPIARIGRFGNDEYALAPVQPDDKGLGNNVQLTAEFTARTTGRLYLYVNDAVLAVPGLSGFFYHTENGFFEPGNNVGTASVTVTAFEK